MLVVFYGPGVVKVNGIRLIAGLITSKETLTGLILVVQNHITNQALKALDLFSFKVEIFQVKVLILVMSVVSIDIDPLNSIPGKRFS